MALASSSNPVVSVLTSRDTALGDSGNYFCGQTPTPGTGIITAAPTTYVATTPMLVVYNGGTLNAYLTYLRLTSTVVGGGAVTKNFSHFIDQGNRYSSGGTALTIANVNALSTTASNVTAYTGAVTATAASANQRAQGSGFFRVAAADVVGDIYEWTFGGPSVATQQIATAMHFVHAKQPIVLPPATSYLLNVWSGTFTQGITFIVELGFVEK